MRETKDYRPLAISMTISVYPHERDALIERMAEEKLKSVFDVVRKLAEDQGWKDLEPPNKRNC